MSDVDTSKEAVERACQMQTQMPGCAPTAETAIAMMRALLRERDEALEVLREARDHIDHLLDDYDDPEESKHPRAIVCRQRIDALLAKLDNTKS